MLYQVSPTVRLLDLFYKGSPYTLKVQIHDASNDIMNISGLTIELVLAYLDSDEEAIFTKEGTIIGDGSDGMVQFEFTKEDTENLPPRIYFLTIYAGEKVAVHGKVILLGSNPRVS